MTLDDLLAALRKRKVELALDGDAILAFPRDRLTDHLRDGIRQHRQQLLARLPVLPDPAPYVYVTEQGGLREVIEALAGAKVVGLDTEVTGLDTRRDRVRLLALAPAAHGPVYLLDCFAIDPSPLWPTLAHKTLAVHNALYDMRVLGRMGFEPGGRVRDTMLMSRLLTAGTGEGNGLKECAARYLRLYVPKDQQLSAWNAPRLTEEQLRYAALDAAVARRLYRALRPMVREAGLDAVMRLERRALWGVRWLADSGVMIDLEAWERLAESAAAEAERARAELDAAAPPKPGGGRWNWNSHKQVAQALGLAGCAVDNTEAETLEATRHPLALAVVADRKAGRFVSTYGMTWFHGALDRGRVYGDWNQCGAITGRMSCSRPNLQNLPRRRKASAPIRKCFIAPPGRVLVRADFGQIELRIAARVSRDKAMTAALLRGEDLHTLTAQRLTGRAKVTKAERDLSKPINFGLIYGLGVKGLIAKAREYGKELTEARARNYRDKFFDAWQGIGAWHERLARRLWRQKIRLEPPEVRTLTGRRVSINPQKVRPTTCANYIVQGTAGDGMKEALALLWERRAAAPPGTFPVLAVHDELVIECDADQAGAAAAWLKGAMTDAMAPLLSPIPVEVEVSAGPSWGEQRPVRERQQRAEKGEPNPRPAPPLAAGGRQDGPRRHRRTDAARQHHGGAAGARPSRERSVPERMGGDGQ
jgi:DNA polymerase I-like protein with 3'-5' exonuclease and polymerase domains